MKQQVQASLFDEPAQMPVDRAEKASAAPSTPPPPVTQSDAERDKRSYAALMEYI